MNDADRALLDLLRALDAAGYGFVTPTPDTHARVLARPAPPRPSLRDVFGWSRTFAEGDLAPDLRTLLHRADALESIEGRLKSRVRVSTLHGRLLLHSAYPTVEADSVFFGPDSYRFADFVCAELGRGPNELGRLADIGTGSGAGALAAATCVDVDDLVLTDINPRALRLARINAAHAGVTVRLVETDSLTGVEGGFDVVLANPPYIVDASERAYRHGGGLHGGRLSLDMAEDALGSLRAGGRLLLYTGAAICGGHNALCAELERLCDDHGAVLSCRELDPDIFGEELSRPEYAEVERIAVIGAVAVKRG